MRLGNWTKFILRRQIQWQLLGKIHWLNFRLQNWTSGFAHTSCELKNMAATCWVDRDAACIIRARAGSSALVVRLHRRPRWKPKPSSFKGLPDGFEGWAAYLLQNGPKVIFRYFYCEQSMNSISPCSFRRLTSFWPSPSYKTFIKPMVFCNPWLSDHFFHAPAVFLAPQFMNRSSANSVFFWGGYSIYPLVN
jgi:hypothetical protein